MCKIGLKMQRQLHEEYITTYIPKNEMEQDLFDNDELRPPLQFTVQPLQK